MSDLGQNWTRLTLNGTNLGLFKIIFSTFWLGEPKCTETDLKKSRPKCTETDLKKSRLKSTETDLKMSQIYPFWGQADPV